MRSLFGADYSMMWRGSDASERNGLVWAVSADDAPGPVLLAVPRRVSPATTNTVGLRVKQVGDVTM